MTTPNGVTSIHCCFPPVLGSLCTVPSNEALYLQLWLKLNIPELHKVVPLATLLSIKVLVQVVFVIAATASIGIKCLGLKLSGLT